MARGEAVGIDAAGGEAVEVEVSVGEAVETSDGEAADQAAARGVEHAPAITAEQAAARIDAARARLRATIAAPYDDDDAPGPPAEPE